MFSLNKLIFWYPSGWNLQKREEHFRIICYTSHISQVNYISSEINHITFTLISSQYHTPCNMYFFFTFKFGHRDHPIPSRLRPKASSSTFWFQSGQFFLFPLLSLCFKNLNLSVLQSDSISPHSQKAINAEMEIKSLKEDVEYLIDEPNRIFEIIDLVKETCDFRISSHFRTLTRNHILPKINVDQVFKQTLIIISSWCL